MTKPEDTDALRAAAAEVLRILHARGFDVHESGRALLAVLATVVAEACRGDRLCLDETLTRYATTLRAFAEEAFSRAPDEEGQAMATASHLNEARALIRRMLEEEEADDRRPVMARLPANDGCRLCPAMAGPFKTVVVRKRLDHRKITLWAVTMVCLDCIIAPDSIERLLGILAEAGGPEIGF